MKLKPAVLALPLLLSACAPEIESDVYVGDIQQVASTGQSLSVPAVIRIPQSSKEACEKGLEQLIANFKALAPTNGKGKCVEKNTGTTTDQLAEIETEMVVASEAAPFDAVNLFLLEVQDAGDAPPTYTLTFRLLRPIDEIVKALAANSDELQADFDPANFIFTLNNDGAGDITFLPYHVFVDGEPGLAENGPITMERRKSAEIQFSDVAASYVEKANGYRFAQITVSGAQ